jgi:hypothetical protein
VIGGCKNQWVCSALMDEVISSMQHRDRYTWGGGRSVANAMCEVNYRRGLHGLQLHQTYYVAGRAYCLWLLDVITMSLDGVCTAGLAQTSKRGKIS